jgi:hypothetical protein
MEKIAILEKQKIELEQELKQLTKDYKVSKGILEKYIKKLQSKINLASNEEILEKIENVKDVLLLKGLKYSGRGDTESRLKEAIRTFSLEPKFFSTDYIGCKNYDRWTCQGVQFKYGMGPRHGSVVFEIGLKRDYRRIDIEEYIDDILSVLNYVQSLTTLKRKDLLEDVEELLK